jgi:hypothetical protein
MYGAIRLADPMKRISFHGSEFLAIVERRISRE